ncbi:Sensitivity To Red Light Reduced-like SRR1 [Pyrenophora seminiperda CCB06]|uniref:Sensitivity To Red Light Reduced-like SRR1 n=1 Tax=Pyrenophora seminiperda CCB06 TaxID=1302712 RepID=A0A3M7LZC6_9PLEO|nr:Sensitivity To Red Light Reduced-like SRR1 [Pyrenophora seminiperda CCB06]
MSATSPQQQQQQQQQEKPLLRCPLAQLRKERAEKMTLSFGPHVFENVAAFEASMNNAPIFTRSLVERAANEAEMMRNGKDIIEIPHICGGGVKKIRPTGADAIKWSWLTTFAIAECKGKAPGYVIKSDYTYFECSDVETLKGPVETLASNDRSLHVWKQIRAMPIPPALDGVKGFEAMVLQSKIWQSLKKRLDELPMRIENVVCIALGGLLSEKELQLRTTTQHLLACFTSRHLSQRHAEASGDALTIPILARDPAYTFEDVRLLSHLEPPITVVSEPYQYLTMTPSTLIIAINPPVFVPYLEMAADLCFPSGPAAMLSYEILDHPWQKDGMATALDPWTPRVGRMLEGMNSVWMGGEQGAENQVDKGYGNELHWYVRKE